MLQAQEGGFGTYASIGQKEKKVTPHWKVPAAATLRCV